ncbi:MAG: ribokinase [Clostridiales bacterium]|nr:ribokinase [Clostridiales bacterium]
MIYVLGSINNDISLELERMPKKGETLIADGCRMGLGGKGANQAVAIAKLAMRGRNKAKKAVKMIGLVGNDFVGSELVKKLDDAGVDTEFVRQVNRNTGTAIVAVTGKDNRIMVYSGANLGISKSDVDEALEHATSADTLLCQLEVPLYIVGYALRKARAIGMTTILNPAPAKELPDDFYYNVDVIVPNETETQMLTGINPKDWNSRLAAMHAFHERGVRYVVLTLGESGCTISDNNRLVMHIPAIKTSVVDTTGAGDTFVGAFALTYPHVGMYVFKEACMFATKASSITVSRRGAAESIPTFEEVCELYSYDIKKK